MFIAIYGATGTGKNTILDLLVRRGYEIIQCRHIEAATPFLTQLGYLTERIRVHLEAQKIANRRDVVTIRTPFDTHLVYSKVLLDMERISQEEFNQLATIADTINPALDPPHASIWTYTSAMTAMNRMSLRSVGIDQSQFNAELKAYAEFAPLIRIPQVEANFDEPMETIQKDFDFNLASLKTTTVTSQSLWKREMLRE